MDRTTHYRSALLVPCKDKAALHRWFKAYLDVDLFDSIVSRHATSTPMDAAWELYNFAMNPPSKTPKQFLYASARSTQKTLLLSAVEIILAIHTARSVVHFAAAREQVKPARKYMTEFCQRPYIRELLKDEPTQSEIVFLIPSYDNAMWVEGKTSKEIYKEDPTSIRETVIELVGISGATTQGKHESIISIDEVSSLKGEKISNYNDIRKIPVASWKGDPFLVFKISTRRGAFSVVEKEIASASKTDLQVRRWTCFEGVEKCPDFRSGTDFVHDRYVNTVKSFIATKEEFSRITSKDKKDFELVKFASGCLACPLAKVCKTDLKNQSSKSRFLQPIEAAIVDYIGSETNFYNSQLLSLMPSKEGQVFTTYDSDVHYITAEEMYEKFMGVTTKVPQDKYTLAKLFRTKGLRPGLGLDWGFTHPFAVTLNYYDKDRVFTIMSFSKEGMEPNKDVIPFLKEMEQKFGKFVIYPDTARPDLNQLLINQGFNVMDDFPKDTDASIETMRRMLKPNIGLPTWYLLAPDCEPLDSEMKTYHYTTAADGTFTDEIDKIDDDSVDSQRYFFLGAFDLNSRLLAPAYEKDRMAITGRSVEVMAGEQIFNLQEKIQQSQAGGSKGSSGGFSWDFGSEEDD